MVVRTGPLSDVLPLSTSLETFPQHLRRLRLKPPSAAVPTALLGQAERSTAAGLAMIGAPSRSRTSSGWAVRTNTSFRTLAFRLFPVPFILRWSVVSTALSPGNMPSSL